jgi:hypothetical protein
MAQSQNAGKVVPMPRYTSADLAKARSFSLERLPKAQGKGVCEAFIALHEQSNAGLTLIDVQPGIYSVQSRQERDQFATAFRRKDNVLIAAVA